MLLFLNLLSLVLRLVFVDASPMIQLGRTTLVGQFFGNIPYAESPLANLRFKAPVLKSSLNAASFNATEYGPACLQVATGLALNQMSEDCLTINIYGGGFVGGQASTANASLIVAQSVARGTPIIFINFNYRLGPLGFPQGQEAGASGAVNLGIKDQFAALQWVQLHIESFGGDKDKVTLFGQSAGSIMMSIQYLNPSICDLARAAIFESGYQGTTPLFPPARGGVPSCSNISTSGSTFECLAKANTTEILQGFASASSESTHFNPWPPVIDGPGGLIPDLPSVLFKRGQFARLPFIAGTVKDEGTTFVPQTVNSTEELYELALSLFSPSSSPTTLQDSIQTLLQLYPDIPALGSPFDTGNETFGLNSQFKRAAAIVGDSDFQSQRRFWMDTAANAGPTFPSALGELAYVYGKPSDTSSSSEQLNWIMTDYWVSYVANLTPNDGLGVPHKPEWTQFTPKNKTLIQLDGLNLTMIPDTYRAGNIILWKVKIQALTRRL
ncbi:extracellular triacylglycerol lipase precursor [Mycena olivaceomarginata]|nr:extracellular triacylglycerol lipase precursor [Mycena olivaceomarginata]